MISSPLFPMFLSLICWKLMKPRSPITLIGYGHVTHSGDLDTKPIEGTLPTSLVLSLRRQRSDGVSAHCGAFTAGQFDSATGTIPSIRFAKACAKWGWLPQILVAANPLERYVAAILDTNAQAKQEPCVFYYLADGPEGGPRMCGNPHFSRCIHQMKCIESEAFIDHELAETIEKREGAVLISVPVPLPSQMVAELNEQDEAGSDTIAKLAALPPPLLPGPAFHFNKKVPLRSVAASIEDLRTRLAQVEAQIAKKKGKTDRRNASLQALLREQDELKTLIEAQQTHDSTTDLRESV